LELKAHQAAAEVSGLSAQINSLDLQIASETTELTSDPTNRHLKATIRGQSKAVRSLSNREKMDLSRLLALNASIEHLGGTPVPVSGSTQGQEATVAAVVAATAAAGEAVAAPAVVGDRPELASPSKPNISRTIRHNLQGRTE
jgi:hypothetical protein